MKQTNQNYELSVETFVSDQPYQRSDAQHIASAIYLRRKSVKRFEISTAANRATARAGYMHYQNEATVLLGYIMHLYLRILRNRVRHQYLLTWPF